MKVQTYVVPLYKAQVASLSLLEPWVSVITMVFVPYK